MKKSTRFLSLLLVLVMVATLLPTFTVEAKADDSSAIRWQNTEITGEKIMRFSKDYTSYYAKGTDPDTYHMIAWVDRHSVEKQSEMENSESSILDRGYDDSNIFILPKGNGVVEFQIIRNQLTDKYGRSGRTDINRWWRWNVWEDGMNANTKGWTDIGAKSIVKSNSVKNKHIIGEGWHDCLKWTGGPFSASRIAQVQINTNLDVGTTSVLWSANGTNADAEGQQMFMHEEAWVYPGDISSHTFTIVESKTVVYYLNGGSYAGKGGDSTAPVGFYCWSSGKAETSQVHDIIQAPTRLGYIFDGWECVKNGGNSKLTVGNTYNPSVAHTYEQSGNVADYGCIEITGDIEFRAKWKPINYQVSFDGNGATEGSMENEKFTYDVSKALTTNAYKQIFTVNYDANGGSVSTTNENTRAESTFVGWEDYGSIVGVDGNTYTKNDFDVANYGTVNGDVRNHEAFGNGIYDKGLLLKHYIEFGKDELESGRNPNRTPLSTTGVRGAYPNNATVRNIATEDGYIVPLKAQWTPVSVTLPTPTAPDGYEFKGWYTADGKRIEGTSFVPADYATPANPVVNLHAEWELPFYVAHVQNGVVVSTEAFKCTDGFNIVEKTSENYLYGGTFSAATCGANEVADFGDGDPASFTPAAGETYYIWEVTKEHLQPLTLCVYERVDACNYDVTDVFLLTAVDRVNYKEAGFYVDGKKTVVKDSTGNVAYDKIGLKLANDTELPMSYYQINPKATTTKNSKIVCYEVDGFNDKQTHTMLPYWVTLDGVEVKGTNTRSFTYNGVGPDQANKQLTVIDSEALYYEPIMVKSFYKAPLMLMPCYSMGQETNPVNLNDIPEVPDEPDVPEVPDEPDVPEVKAMLNVVDGENTYEVEISDDMALIAAGVDGQLFGGWFADKGCTIPADLSKATDGDTVYAKYISDSYLQVKYSFNLLTKKLSLTSAVDSKDYAETGYVISTKNGDKSVVVTDYASRFALQNAKQLFGVEKNAPLMNVDYKLSGLSKNDKITITPYLVTADGTTVYGTARTLTYTGLTVRG